MKAIILLSTLTLFCSYCNSTKPVNTNNSILKSSYHSKLYGTDLNGKWQLQSLWGMDHSKISGAYINMNFDQRTFTGNAGCNNISGTFTLKDDLLLFDKNITIDKNECPAYIDKKFITILQKINHFQVNDDVMELSQDNIVLMAFKKTSDL